MFTITLADGSQISNLKLNGNNFISGSEIRPEMFAGKLSGVTITGTGSDDEAGLIGSHEHMELVQITREDSEYWFILRDISEVELKEAKTQSDIAYLSMMTGVDLD